jgi:glycosyltransferase involved in cell wall biosynthesis
MMIAPHFEEYAYLLAHGIAETRDVTLVVDTQTLTMEFAGRMLPVQPRLTVRANRFRSLADFMRLVGDVIRFRPQVIHWQEPSGLIKSIMAALLVLVCRPFVTIALTIHDPVPHGGRDARVARRLAVFRRYTRRRVHRIFVHGPTCRAQYLTQYLPAPHHDPRIALTEHGVILSGQKESAPRAPFQALMFGRMETYKGLAVLCRATAILASEGHAIALRIAGAGPELDVLEAEFQAYPSVTVENRFVAAADLVAMIQDADCVLLPYTSATQSGVLAAAFGNGRFVIASKVGGIVDVVDDGVNGLLIEPGDARALAHALHAVATDAPLRNRLREGARRTALERLSWSRIAADLIACY